MVWAVTPFFYFSFRSYTLTPSSARYLRVPSGSTLREVARSLRDEGFIEHPLIFMILVVLHGGEDKIRAGTYHFEGEVSIDEIVKDLLSGNVATRRITIPEGMNFEDIVVQLGETAGWESDGIRSLRSSSDLIALLGLDVENLEGFLFPDTYIVPVDITPQEFLGLMIQRYREVFNDSLRDRSAELGYSEIEIVALASIIEKETSLESERKIISGVFHNRLERGIPLEADPTIRYALRKYTCRILYKYL
jgi:UPF0755 protein